MRGEKRKKNIICNLEIDSIKVLSPSFLAIILISLEAKCTQI